MRTIFRNNVSFFSYLQGDQVYDSQWKRKKKLPYISSSVQVNFGYEWNCSNFNILDLVPGPNNYVSFSRITVNGMNFNIVKYLSSDQQYEVNDFCSILQNNLLVIVQIEGILVQSQPEQAVCFVVGTIFYFDKESQHHYGIIPKKTSHKIQLSPNEILSKYLHTHNCTDECMLHANGRIEHSSNKILLHIQMKI